MGNEPRGVTTGDKVALGVGLALGLLSLPGWVATAASYPWMGIGIFMRNSLGFWLAAVTLSVVVVTRTGRYGRLPRPAEWLALTCVAWGLATSLPPMSHEDLTALVLRPFVFLNLSHPTGRWVALGVISAFILAGWVIVRLGRSVLPPAVQTVWLTFLIFLAIWSPLTTLGLHAADWIAPSQGFGRGNAIVLYRGLCQWFASTPLALMVGWPVVATLAERAQGRTWTWLETAIAVVAGIAGLIATVVFRGEFPPVSFPGLAERALAAVWVAAVGWLDLGLIRVFPSLPEPVEAQPVSEPQVRRWTRGEATAGHPLGVDGDPSPRGR